MRVGQQQVTHRTGIIGEGEVVPFFKLPGSLKHPAVYKDPHPFRLN